MTDANGQAVMPKVPVPTEGTVTVEKDGKVVTVPVKVDEHGAMTPATVDLSDANIATVTVTVVEKGTTTGIANATVTVGAQKVQAGANGEVTLRLVKNGTYNGVTASATGYLNDTVELKVNDAGTAVSPDKIELRKTAPVTVTVTDGGNSVDGATVTIVDDDGKKHEATTGADGRTTVQGVPVPTEGTVTVKKDGKVVTVPVTVDEHGVMDPRTVDLTEANIAPVTVTVVEKGATPEKAISGAAVTVGAQASAATGTDGVATLYLVKGATYTGVTASAAGYADSTVTLKVESDGSFAPSKIELVKTATVAVTVTKDGTNVDGATVTIVGKDGKKHEATTNSDGEATVKDVPVPTKGTVTVTKDGKVVTVPVTVDETGKADPNTIDLNLSNGVTLNIFDKELNLPIEGAAVTVGAQVSDRTTITSGGVVSLSLAMGAKYSIKVSAPGYKDSILDLLIQPGGSADPKFIYLVRKGQKDVTVQVVDGNGNVEGAAVTIVDTDGRSYPAITGTDGRAAMKDVPTPTAGTVTVEKDGKVVTVPVKVFPDGWMTPTPVSIAEENVRAVTVRVVEEGSDPAKPIVGATVTVGAQAVQTTAPNGEATLRLIGKAEYPAVLATATGYDSRSVELTVDGSGAASPAVIALAKKARKDVTLQVVEGSDKVFGAEVTIADADGTIYRKVTDANGEVVVPKVLAPTQWLVTVEVSSVQIKKTVRVDVNADGVASPSTIDIGVNPLVVSLTVVDRQTGGPIEGAEVAIGTDRSVTEASGEVAFLLGADGIYSGGVRGGVRGFGRVYTGREVPP